MKGKEEDISINVNIAGVAYPIRVNPSEESGVRKAEKMVNDRLRALKDDYGVTDRQMLLSMLTMQLASELVQKQDGDANRNDGITEQIKQLDRILDSALGEI